MKNTDLWFPVQQMPTRMNTKKSTSKLIFKLLETNDKEKISKAVLKIFTTKGTKDISNS